MTDKERFEKQQKIQRFKSSLDAWKIKTRSVGKTEKAEKQASSATKQTLKDMPIPSLQELLTSNKVVEEFFENVPKLKIKCYLKPPKSETNLQQAK